ncbi:hypothetical protein KsCSTR_15580 [Candidatus Kuenenia stuttgartiensis]|uniref:Uncharacterized protein n=1 Tax=Kuenenia stuttgartiensis TaxID=174633 RepID=Q1Q1M9_KUEST|nr:hypothetical protein KsCSTR_15580 [Candidatus Kuenenia stuttgartiensis]CAJ73914.1 unknown protein [Candidatus Kuenenia stuttgartiensis]
MAFLLLSILNSYLKAGGSWPCRAGAPSAGISAPVGRHIIYLDMPCAKTHNR